MRTIPALALVFIGSTCLHLQFAQGAALGPHFDVGGMFLNNALDQGGQGPSGSSLLTQVDFFWNFPWVGFGVFAQYDRQGAGETDFGAGPKMEIHYGPLFLDAGYGVLMSRAFNDRAISRQNGAGYYFGLGFRAYLSKEADLGGFFLQFSYRFRTVSIRTQDGVALTEPIRQLDGYPLVGVGYSF